MTPPFLIDQRVVVLRDAGRLLTADVPRLIEVVDHPLPTTVLIVVAGGGTVPAPLAKAITKAGQVIDTSVSKAGDRKAWMHDHLRQGPVKLEPQAAQLLATHVGEDLSRVEGLLTALSAAYGEGARISVEDLEPYLGEAGNVPRYELTEAISRGETANALGVLHRMFDAGGLSAVEVMGTMNRHYGQLLALDGASVSGEREAAELLAVAPFVAKKALDQSRRLGSARIAQAITLLADADLDVKGGSGLPPELVIEIVVARLSRQTRPKASSGRR
jgi:DNA polymerase-3 subunit delta